MLPWWTCDSKVLRSLSRTKASEGETMQASRQAGRQLQRGVYYKRSSRKKRFT